MKKNLLFLFLFVSLITNAQERLLSGKVVNQNNEPLGGASVIVKGLNKGVATDEEGNFKLRLAEGGYTTDFLHRISIERTRNQSNCG